jgi:sulfur relay (sulfurtransferase) DsrF/TusC family protein
MSRALLIGQEPPVPLGVSYVKEGPYDAVVIGSLTLSQLLRFREESVLSALAQGKSVYLYTPGLPEAPKNRALAATLAAGQRELKNWGVIFTDGGRKRLITAQEAREMRAKGLLPGAGAVMTPLAREILGGSE